MDTSLQVKNYLRKVNQMPYSSITLEDIYKAFDLDEDGDVSTVEYFFDHEHLIKKPACFWKVASTLFYLIGGDERWVGSFHRNNRFTFPFADRLRATTQLYPAHLPPHHEDKQLFDGYVEKNVLTSYINHFETINDDDEITIYRSFKVREGEVVRKGVVKLDNPDAHIQVEGSGISYTMNLLLAVAWMNQQYNPYFLKKYGDLHSPEEQRQLIDEAFLSATGADWEKENILTEKAYSCLGTYTVKKKDIYFITPGHMEEVVVNPASVKLERYDFLSWAESMSGTYIKIIFQALYNSQQQHLSGQEGASTSGMIHLNSLETNVKLLLQIGTRYYSFFYNHPDAIKALWMTPKNKITKNHLAMMDKEQEIRYALFGQVLSEGADTVDWGDVKQQVDDVCILHHKHFLARLFS